MRAGPGQAPSSGPDAALGASAERSVLSSLFPTHQLSCREPEDVVQTAIPWIPLSGVSAGAQGLSGSAGLDPQSSTDSAFYQDGTPFTQGLDLRYVTQRYVPTASVAAHNPFEDVFNARVIQMYEESHDDLKQPPRVGHRELNLYKLFVAVQRRGGHAKISQWKDLADVLELPSTVTNAGYVLRKNYEKYLLPIEGRLREEFPILSAAVSEESDQLAAMGTREMVAARRKLSAGGWQPQGQTPVPGAAPQGQGPFRTPQISSSQLRAMGASANLSFSPASEALGWPGWPGRGGPAGAGGGAEAGQSFIPGQAQPVSPLKGGQVLPSFSERVGERAGDGNIFQMPTVTTLALTNVPFTDRMIAEFLKAYPSLQRLKLGSLRAITKLPPASAFPATLRVLELMDVPQALLGGILDSYSPLRLISLQVTPWPPIFGSSPAQRLAHVACLAQASVQAHGGAVLWCGARPAGESGAGPAGPAGRTGLTGSPGNSPGGGSRGSHGPRASRGPGTPDQQRQGSAAPPGSPGEEYPALPAGTTYLVPRVSSSSRLAGIASVLPVERSVDDPADEPMTFRLPEMRLSPGEAGDEGPGVSGDIGAPRDSDV